MDRVSKFYVISQTEEILSSNLFTSKFLNISLIWNEVIAFGLLSFDHDHFYNFLTILITIVVIVIFIMIWKNEGLKKYSLIMILGGALGNLYDRIFQTLRRSDAQMLRGAAGRDAARLRGAGGCEAERSGRLRG